MSSLLRVLIARPSERRVVSTGQSWGAEPRVMLTTLLSAMITARPDQHKHDLEQADWKNLALAAARWCGPMHHRITGPGQPPSPAAECPRTTLWHRGILALRPARVPRAAAERSHTRLLVRCGARAPIAYLVALGSAPR